MGLTPVHKLPWPEPTDPADGPAGFQALATATELAIGGAPASGGVLPASPVDGQVVDYLADATAGIIWRFRYRTAAAGSYKWEFIGGPAMTDEITTQESTSSTTLTNLATVGPSITVPLAGDYLIELGANISGLATSDTTMSFAVGGTSAVTADGVKLYNGIAIGGTAFNAFLSRAVKKTGIAASSAIVAKYGTTFGSGTGFYGNRWLKITPRRVG
jgi:hypothetical protein